jgi:hypothetical protein
VERHCTTWIHSSELFLFNATRSCIWRGPLGYVPWRKSFSNLVEFTLLFFHSR